MQPMESAPETEPAALAATIHLAFAFDVGYEIDLDAARKLVAVEDGALPRRKRTPESIRYRPAPLRFAVDAADMKPPTGLIGTSPARAELSVFDFGAVSLMVRFPVAGSSGALSLAGRGAGRTVVLDGMRPGGPRPLDRAARPAVIGFEVSALSEEYVVFQIGEVRPAGWPSTPTGSPAWCGSNPARSASRRSPRRPGSASRTRPTTW